MKVILFGATGSAGGSVLRSCLAADDVRSVSVISRRPLAGAHPKRHDVVHLDFLDFSGLTAEFSQVDACFYCLGVSVTQVPDEQTYRVITHDFALAAARMLRAASPTATFHFISGAGTGTDRRAMWARVKGETERELMELVPAVCWRPAFIDGADSMNAPRLYQAIRPLFRLLRPFKGLYVNGDDLGKAMLQAARERWRDRIVENREIRAVAARSGR